MRLNGHKVLVTGAGTGMGLEAARQLTARGSRVVMVARNAERLRREAERLTGSAPYACDITNAGQVEALVASLATDHPDLDVLLLNAGVTHTYRLFGEEDAYAHAQVEMHTNFFSALRLINAFVPYLQTQREPALIVTTSGVAFAPDITNPTYSASKAALHSLVQSVRLQLERNRSAIEVYEFMAPLVDSPFSAGVDSDQKIPAADAVRELLAGLEGGQLELHVGASADVYKTLQQSSDAAVRAVNAATGG